MKFENRQKPCIICEKPTFLRTDGGKRLCAIHFISYASIDEVMDGTGTENLILEKKKVASQARRT